MKHCILVKFKEKDDTTNCLDDIKNIFNEALSINGIYRVDYYLNCIDRENRYDLLIKIDMDEEALEEYDRSNAHKLWKEKYGPKLQNKAIFDFNE